MAAQGLPRATGDIDLWVQPTPEKADRVWRALAEFGAPLDRLSPADLTTPDTVVQFGASPRRIDLMTSIDGVEFGEAWAERVVVRVDDVDVPVISRAHLIRNKRATGRPQDAADAERLERAGGP
ncbi:MAG: hypothetical protein ABR499_00145 [Gemmatimonadaceae bacterium]